MDIGLFYGLFSATCFTLVGLWWSVVERRADVRTDPRARRDAGAIYLTFLLPALMGLFAQIGGLDSPMFWRVSFVVIALIGVASMVRIALGEGSQRRGRTGLRWVLVGLYAVVALIGAAPTLVAGLGVTALQVEAALLVLLVATGHGLVWDAVLHNQREPGTG